MNKIIYLIWLLLVFSLMIQCVDKNATEPEKQEFFDTVWYLELLEIANDERLLPPAGQIYTIQFLPDSSFRGRNVCNDIGGTYKLVANSQIIIEKLGTTFVYCPNGTIHDEYYGALDNIKNRQTKYEIRKSRLYIDYGINSRMIFMIR